ncbi:Bcr/CflA family drug resistance efflux transporter [Tateyamaria omphalii]|uniref:multidrug effflux MFS transporter n=1 Tax=Tateyamaria omphalii TaxID=299262 RepID=UPI0016730772|nr:multidrug effflux MFS transporter [Tateyamaria omphalii]GGX46110.1 Bcr/CflA family drug resistance efflux transporter [Tateyamaria omphalii]
MTRTQPHLATLVLLTALSVLTLNMFLPALPAMREAFDVSEAVMGRSISLYMLAAAVLQLLLGSLSDRLGRRPVILGLLVLYAMASVLCLMAENITLFLLARTGQAVAVGGGILASAVVRDMYDGRQAAAKLSLIASAMAIAPMLAPMLGGLLETAFGWRSVFVTYAVLGGGLLLWCLRDLGETHTPGPGRSMRVGALLRERLFWAYVGIQALGVGAFYMFLTGAPFVAADVFGLEPAQIGIALGSTTAGFMLGAGLSARLVQRIEPMRLILLGRILPIFAVGAAIIYYMNGGATVAPLFLSTVVAGIGNGLSLANANAGALSVRPDLAGSASGVSGAIALGLGAALSWLTTAVLGDGATPQGLLLLILAALSLALAAALAAAAWEQGETGVSNQKTP